jgi:hypothetical protein
LYRLPPYPICLDPVELLSPADCFCPADYLLSRRNKGNKGKCLRHGCAQERSDKFLLFPLFDYHLPLSRLDIAQARLSFVLGAPSALRD